MTLLYTVSRYIYIYTYIIYTIVIYTISVCIYLHTSSTYSIIYNILLIYYINPQTPEVSEQVHYYSITLYKLYYTDIVTNYSHILY